MVFSPFRPSQQKTLAAVIAAMAEVAPATSLAVAGHLAEECSVPHRRALHRFDRLLHHPRLDNQRRTALWLPLCGPGPRLRIAFARTAWQHALRRLVAAVVVGRAISALTAVFQQTTSVRSQTTWEHRCLRPLAYTRCETGQSSVVLCGRRSRRARWLQWRPALQQALVVRLLPDVIV
jgi:hypothetical protein